MNQAGRNRVLAPASLKELYRHNWRPNLKIPLFYGMLFAAGYLAWRTPSPWARWSMYVGMGYLWMSIVTFMHDCTHDVLFKARWKNWAFGIFSMIPLLVTFVSFKEDHLEHHRYNRSPKDPDAFTMGQRGVLDFVLFYVYIVVGGVLTILQFTLIYPLQKFNSRQWLIHGSEVLLRVVVLGGLILWASRQGVLSPFLQLWLVPAYIFSLFNSVRFIGEHYGTPWNAGQMLGTRTIISNQANSFFWNNINYHIGHHIYPGVPWYNLQKLHAALLPEIERTHAVVDPGYWSVFFQACRGGPESVERNALRFAKRTGAAFSSEGA
ncbi:MAG: fatty acid desaturase [Deltaproteobacteria bacterium]|nr:fatty acid desaturase [Deltaproteobacteria bacterium]